jgi:hypothetical protein
VSRSRQSSIARSPSVHSEVDEYLPLRKLAAYAGLSLRTLRSHLASGSHPLPHYRIGGKILVRRCDYDRWAVQFRVERPAVSIDALVDDVLKDLR